MGIIQNAINQIIGSAAIAKRLSPGTEEKIAEQRGKAEAKAKAAETRSLAEPAIKNAEKLYAEFETAEQDYLKRGGRNGRPKSNAYENALDAIERATASTQRALSYDDTWEEGYNRLKDLDARKQKIIDTKERRTVDKEKSVSALQKSAQIQEFKKQQKENFNKFAELFTQGGLYK